MIGNALTGFYDRLKLYPDVWTASGWYAGSHSTDTVSNTGWIFTDLTYQVGDLIVPTTYNGYTYVCTTSGESGAPTEPTWSTSVGDTVSDGTAMFTTYDSKTYQVKAPETASVPYVTFGLLTESPVGDFSDFETVEDLTFWVNCFSDKSMAGLFAVADDVMDALDDTTVSVSGYTSMKVVREFIGSPIWDNETDIFMLPLRYRVWVCKD